MHILFLTQIIPYPPDSGPKVKTWHVLRYLVEQGHKVTLASFLRPEEAPHVPALEALLYAVHTIPIRRSRLADVGYMLRSFLSGRPFLIERDDLPGMRDLVAGLLACGDVDAVHADQLTMTQFVFPRNGTPGDGWPTLANGAGSEGPQNNLSDVPRTMPARVFDAHNAVWTIVERMNENAAWFLKPILSLEARRIREYEAGIVRHFTSTLAVTEPDKQALLDGVGLLQSDGKAAAESIRVIPIAVDTGQLLPVRRDEGSREIVTLGTLHYPPNADGIRWFMREVFPLIRKLVPDSTLTIIGKNPPPDFTAFADQNPGQVKVTGYVPDLTPYLERAALMVVPVRAGGGMRVRILEAFARGMPVITTTIGLEGIEAAADQDVLVADSPEAFAGAVARVIQDPAMQASLAENGRRLAESRYDWQVVLEQLNHVYVELEADRKNAG